MAAKKGGKTPLTNFRLGPDTLAELDRLAELIGEPGNRSAAVRHAAKTAAAGTKQPMLPHYGDIPCGPPAELPDSPPGMLDVAALFRGANRFLLTARGDSMQGRQVNHGDYLVIQRQDTADHGQTVVASADGQVTLKVFHVRKNKKGQIEYWLYPASDHHQPIMLQPGGDNKVIGVLVGVIRKC